jgi:hypothetical protein
MNKRAYYIGLLLLAILASSCSPIYATEEPNRIEQPKPISTSKPAESAITSGMGDDGLIDLTGIKSGDVPDDIQEHLSGYAEVGGGFICQSPPLELNEDLNENVYVYSLTSKHAEWCFVGLGESIDENVTATLELPDGSVQQLESIVEYDEWGSESNIVRFRYRFDETSDRKPHRFITELSGRHIEIQFIPVVEGYYFGGFVSNEPVRVLIYEIFDDYTKFHTEQYTTADSSGELWIKFKDLFDGAPHIFVIGETTGCRYKKVPPIIVMRQQARGTIDMECDSSEYQQP